MILIISAREAAFEAAVERRFGRAPFLVRVDSETKAWEAFPNPGASQPGGAGVAAAQFVVDKKADVVVSGDFGPNAANAFRAAHVEMRLLSPSATTVNDAITQYVQGSLQAMQ